MLLTNLNQICLDILKKYAKSFESLIQWFILTEGFILIQKTEHQYSEAQPIECISSENSHKIPCRSNDYKSLYKYSKSFFFNMLINETFPRQ